MSLSENGEVKPDYAVIAASVDEKINEFIDKSKIKATPSKVRIIKIELDIGNPGSYASIDAVGEYPISHFSNACEMVDELQQNNLEFISGFDETEGLVKSFEVRDENGNYLHGIKNNILPKEFYQNLGLISKQ